ncbi:rod-determining factor RdfA [Halorussus sp. AFM4]|uniref:rod-determining factor RdfA n=1 Tax=Halorussus sp. AFM4 TaxID=3421651 RepID=UPI003EC120B3
MDYITEKYDLQNADDRIIRKREREDASLRALETYLNRWVLRREMVEQGMNVLDGEAANYHRLLSDDEVLKANTAAARRELESAGIDVDEVLGDFVSYQTVRKHLNECLDKDTSEEYTPDLDEGFDTIEALLQRVKSVTARTINRFRRHDVASIGEVDIIVSVKLRCGDCGRVHSLHQFMDSPHCPCAKDASMALDGRRESNSEAP